MENTDILWLTGVFDTIKHIDQNIEWRSARDLQKILWYTEWRNFCLVIEKAQGSCKVAWWLISNHFVDINKMVKIWSEAERSLDDFMLSRYACYLIAQNGDSKKQEIAFAQAYFATQTRKQEVLEQYMQEHQRLLSRQKLKTTETEFQKLAYERWVDGEWIARIRSKWDTVLFWWKTTQEMKQKYWVKSGPLADHLPEVTIKAKDLATEVTNYNMKTRPMLWESVITKEHIKNTQWVRDYLIQSGIKPEELPPAEDLKKIERRQQKEVKKLIKDWLKK